MADETKRVIDQTTDSSLSAGDFIIVDSQSEGTRKFDLGTELTDIKEDLQNLQEEIEGGGGGSGLTTEEKTLIITIMRNGLYSTDQSDNIDALEDAFFAPVPATGINLNQSSLSFATLNATQQLTATLTPRDATDTVTWYSSNDSVATVSQTGLVTSVGYGNATITATAGSVSATCSILVAQATVTSISAVYTQSGTVYDSDSLDSLTDDLVVTAHWSNGTTTTLSDDEYTLSGTLTEGTSTITVSYGGQTTTFNVTVTHFSISLDTIIYEGKSYRDVFMTANQLQGFDFESGIPQGCTVNAGSPTITDEESYSTSHSLKLFGTGSTQYRTVNVTGVVDWNKYQNVSYFTAFKAKCDRYVSGNLGIQIANSNHIPTPVTSVTDGWITKHLYVTAAVGTAATFGYIGSFTSANLDGYLDDVVLIPMSDIFTEIPTEAQMLQWYNEYCDIRKDGGV